MTGRSAGGENDEQPSDHANYSDNRSQANEDHRVVCNPAIDLTHSPTACVGTTYQGSGFRRKFSDENLTGAAGIQQPSVYMLPTRPQQRRPRRQPAHALRFPNGHDLAGTTRALDSTGFRRE